MTRYLLLFDSYGLVFVGRLLRGEDGSVFVHAACPCQRSISRVRVLSDSRPYFTVSDLRLPFSSPPTTRRVTVEVFDPTSTRITEFIVLTVLVITYRHATHRKHCSSNIVCVFVTAVTCLLSRSLETGCVRSFIKNLLS
jgi:hypothetical protein